RRPAVAGRLAQTLKITAVNKPWSAIVAHYAEYDGPSMQAMHALAERIASGPLATGLYAWTSMFDLCITQTEAVYPYTGPYLKVSPLADGQIEFRYLDTMEQGKQWHRVVEPEAAIARLLEFLKNLHWFPGELLQP
ncbi:hypothetical protein LNV23_23880, partial [Paucibacter sp. DJ1R-11]|uniref:hypothetical protein n=1 Tax=Paucibacter sp. DJ1R-11 TaxID=2893556 RepID=UPI0021E4A0D8